MQSKELSNEPGHNGLVQYRYKQKNSKEANEKHSQIVPFKMQCSGGKEKEGVSMEPRHASLLNMYYNTFYRDTSL